MDPESDPQSTIISHEIDGKMNTKVRINPGPYAVHAIFFIAAFAGHIVTIVLGVPLFNHCYNVALVVMINGSVLGILQQVPEFVRNFIKIKPEHAIYVNYVYGLTIILRIVWLITATVVIVNSNCEDITVAWISIYVNWGVLGIIVIAISIAMMVKFFNGRRQI